MFLFILCETLASSYKLDEFKLLLQLLSVAFRAVDVAFSISICCRMQCIARTSSSATHATANAIDGTKNRTSRWSARKSGSTPDRHLKMSLLLLLA